MGRPVAAFLDEVLEYLDDRVFPEVHNQTYFFDECVSRSAYDEQAVYIRDLRYLIKDENDHIQRVNGWLGRFCLRIDFQFIGTEPEGTWTESLAQFTVAADHPDIDTPTVSKWEANGDVNGNLKADERFDEREYIEENIRAKDALELAVMDLMFNFVPERSDRSEASPLPPNVIKLFFNEDSETLDQLQPESN